MRNFIFTFFLVIVFFFSIPIRTYCESSLEQDFPILSNVYNFDEETTDYIIVVDQSGSVKKFWEPIKSSASKLVTIVNEGDYLTLVGFKETVDNLIIPLKITSENRNAIINQIHDLSEPRGQYTDLYESVNFVLEKGINRPGGSKLQFIFYFTDFINQPPSNSQWKTTSTNVLIEKRINYVDKTGKLINIFAFQLPLEAGAGRDFDKFSTIFDNKVTRILSDLNSMQEWFERLSQEIYREKLKLVLQNDLTDFLTIKGIAIQGEQIVIEVHNKLKFATLIKQVELKSDFKELQVIKNDKIFEIAGNGDTNIYLSISEFIPKNQVTLEQQIEIPRVELKFHCSFESLENEFGKLNISSNQEQHITNNKKITTTIGIPYWIIIGAVLFLILIIYLIYKWWLKPEWTFNRKGFKITFALDGDLLPSSVKTYEKSKKPIVIDHTIINRSDIDPETAKKISETGFKIYVVPAKPKFFSSRPKRGTYLFAEGKGINFTLKKLVKGKMVHVSLPKSRRLFAERIFLHKGVTIIGKLTSGIKISELEINFYNK
jgi:tetrahydromethanopterin S-methyltransferase subunit G